MGGMAGNAGTRAIHPFESIAESLAERIRNGEWGVYLPSERKLTEEYNVARVTLRKALARIEREGYITRIPGRRGTFVVPRP